MASPKKKRLRVEAWKAAEKAAVAAEAAKLAEAQRAEAARVAKTEAAAKVASKPVRRRTRSKKVED